MESQPPLPQASAIAPLAPAAAGVGEETRVAELPVSAGVVERRVSAAAWVWRRRLATPAALLALLLLSGAFFWKIVLLHQVLLPGDVLYAHDPLWGSLAPPGFTTPANPLDSDALTEFYPWTALASTALHHGVLPLWNPYAFAGTPFLGAMQTAVFYPINLLLEWLIPPIDVLGWRAIVHLAAGMIGTFLFTRRLGLSRPAALLSALTFGLGLPNMVWLEHPMAGAIAWLPWLLLCIDRVAATGGRLRWVVVTAALAALDILAGHGESTVHALLLCTAFAVFRLAPSLLRAGTRGAGIRALIGLLTTLVLSAGIAAAYLLPTLAQIPLSEAAADRGTAMPLGLLGNPSLWKTLVVAIIPDYFGSPTWHAALLPLDHGYNELALYAGTVPLFLALLALRTGRSPTAVFFAATALVALGIALRFPLVGQLDNLPALRLAANGRLRVEYTFAVAVLAGYGLDALIARTAVAMAWRWVRVWGLVVVACAGLAIAGLSVARPGGEAIPLGTAGWAALPVAWCALFIGLLWLRRRQVIGPGMLRAAAVAVVAVDLYASGIGYHTTVSRATVLTVPPAVRSVQQDHSLYRVGGLGAALLPSLSSLYGLQDVRGYDPAYAAAYERYFGAAFGITPGMRLALAPFGPSPGAARMLNLMNVKYLFAPCAVVLNKRFYTPVYRGAGCVYRNRSALPRAMLVHELRWATPSSAERLLRDGLVDPRRVALLDPATASRNAWRSAPGGPPSPVVPPETVRVTHYGLNAVALAVRASRPAVLVLTDAYAPGWYGAVDGHAAPLARVDAIFRAVAVGPGAHIVTFTYQPQTFAVGMAVSLFALVVWLLLAATALWRGVSGRRSGGPSGRRGGRAALNYAGASCSGISGSRK